jgi:hypothetical protein
MAVAESSLRATLILNLFSLLAAFLFYLEKYLC